MVPISIEKFIQGMEKGHSEKELKEMKESILAAAQRKKNGQSCIQCGKPIWAIGSGITDMNFCFTCTTGEADDSEDYELDTVCY
ncbi:hypothetical protein LGQ02_17980 [Bacillus shivajii]|uniref:hypothetical protein n=1 Tax=Bacillus shivajii TaxID=1983719 RepID=UPI001CFA873B|nr:hypothetical protein [Bacillus shivajii]UCZ52675.1 hypothetical protein LGQ02_17980 [Bacillus shivajii]